MTIKKVIRRNLLHQQAIDFLVKSIAVCISTSNQTFVVPTEELKRMKYRRLIRRLRRKHILCVDSQQNVFTDKDETYLLRGMPAVVMQLYPAASFSGVDVEKVFDECTTAKSFYKDVPSW